jgi:hypothetical protein
MIKLIQLTKFNYFQSNWLWSADHRHVLRCGQSWDRIAGLYGNCRLNGRPPIRVVLFGNLLPSHNSTGISSVLLIQLWFTFELWIKGSLIGFIVGVVISLLLSIGSLLIPRPKVSLPTTLNACPPDVLQYAYNRYNGLPNSSYIESYDNPE